MLSAQGVLLFLLVYAFIFICLFICCLGNIVPGHVSVQRLSVYIATWSKGWTSSMCKMFHH